MPYIGQLSRDYYDTRIGELAEGLCHKLPGELTYILFALCKQSLRRDFNYQDLCQVLGCLESCKLELYRRLVVPYEEDAIKRNGDV